MINEEENMYQEKGYMNREDYLKCLSEDYGMDLHAIHTLADVLGEEEDFDGLVAELDDIEYLSL